MIRVKMLYGGYEDADNPEDYFLMPVGDFPVAVEPPDEEGEERKDENGYVNLEDEGELRNWAEKRFGPFWHIWDMEVPEDAIVASHDAGGRREEGDAELSLPEASANGEE